LNLGCPLKPVARDARARLGLRQRTIKGWHTAVDQLITSNGLGTTLCGTWAVVAVRCKITNFSLKSVKETQYNLE
jgi:hypothetical protein